MERVGVVAVHLALLAGCSQREVVVRQLPSAAEREARTMFVEGHPELPPQVKDDLLRFRTTPEEALRRFDYVRARPGLRA